MPQSEISRSQKPSQVYVLLVRTRANQVLSLSL